MVVGRYDTGQMIYRPGKGFRAKRTGYLSSPVIVTGVTRV